MRAGRLLLVLCCSSSLLGGCAPKYEEPANVFQTTTGTSGRTLECTSKAADGSCNVKKCTQSTEGMSEYGVPYDCASYAAACVDAGQYWSGTKEGGSCTRVL
jgi:hypothetical protein